MGQTYGLSSLSFFVFLCHFFSNFQEIIFVTYKKRLISAYQNMDSMKKLELPTVAMQSTIFHEAPSTTRAFQNNKRKEKTE